MRMVWLMLCAVVLQTVCVVGTCRAQSDESMMKASLLIDDDLSGNMAAIQEVTKGLSLTQKMVLYKDHETSAGLPFVLNLFLATGIGSWVQGHTVGGLIGTVGTVGGVGLMLTSDKNAQTIGAIVLSASYITDLILPWTYSSAHNTRLKRAIGYSSVSVLHVGPTIDLASNGRVIPGIGVSVGF